MAKLLQSIILHFVYREMMSSLRWIGLRKLLWVKQQNGWEIEDYRGVEETLVKLTNSNEINPDQIKKLKIFATKEMIMLRKHSKYFLNDWRRNTGIRFASTLMWINYLPSLTSSERCSWDSLKFTRLALSGVLTSPLESILRICGFGHFVSDERWVSRSREATRTKSGKRIEKIRSKITAFEMIFQIGWKLLLIF